MKIEDLLRSNTIKRETFSTGEVRKTFELAKRDLKTAQNIINESMDWAFSIAYNSVLQASRAYMFSLGYRPGSKDTHKNTFAFMLASLGEEYRESVEYFDRMRRKRHQAVYDIAGVVTETEVKTLLEKAEEFVKIIGGRIGY